MLVRELPGTSRLARMHANFCELTLGRAARMSTRLLLDPGMLNRIRAQWQISADLIKRIECTDLTGSKRVIQIGANDGKHDDPIQHILATTSVGAVLVEPMPIAFEALAKLHGERPYTQLVNAAISRTGGDMSLFMPVVKGQELHSSVWACRSAEQARVEVKRNMGRQALKVTEVVETPVQSLTAAELLERSAVSPEDVALLVCDTEGQDAEIVHSFLNTGARPQVIFYEQLFAPKHQSSELGVYLSELGYKMQDTEKDVLATLLG